jgi:hypothetical protein
LLKLQTETPEKLVEARNTVVPVSEDTIGTSLTVQWLQRVELALHTSQLAVEDINRGVLLTSRASELQSGDVESSVLGW